MARLKLNPGDHVCDLCEGKGKIPAEKNPDVIIGIVGQLTKCPKCQGVGKLDWIENVIGKKKEVEITMCFSDSSSSIHCEYLKRYVDQIAQELANEIDKDILRMLEGKA